MDGKYTFMIHEVTYNKTSAQEKNIELQKIENEKNPFIAITNEDHICNGGCFTLKYLLNRTEESQNNPRLFFQFRTSQWKSDASYQKRISIVNTIKKSRKKYFNYAHINN